MIGLKHLLIVTLYGLMVVRRSVEGRNASIRKGRNGDSQRPRLSHRQLGKAKGKGYVPTGAPSDMPSSVPTGGPSPAVTSEPTAVSSSAPSPGATPVSNSDPTSTPASDPTSTPASDPTSTPAATPTTSPPVADPTTLAPVPAPETASRALFPFTLSASGAFADTREVVDMIDLYLFSWIDPAFDETLEWILLEFTLISDGTGTTVGGSTRQSQTAVISFTGEAIFVDEGNVPTEQEVQDVQRLALENLFALNDFIQDDGKNWIVEEITFENSDGTNNGDDEDDTPDDNVEQQDTVQDGDDADNNNQDRDPAKDQLPSDPPTVENRVEKNENRRTFLAVVILLAAILFLSCAICILWGVAVRWNKGKKGNDDMKDLIKNDVPPPDEVAMDADAGAAATVAGTTTVTSATPTTVTTPAEDGGMKQERSILSASSMDDQSSVSVSVPGENDTMDWGDVLGLSSDPGSPNGADDTNDKNLHAVPGLEQTETVTLKPTPIRKESNDDDDNMRYISKRSYSIDTKDTSGAWMDTGTHVVDNMDAMTGEGRSPSSNMLGGTDSSSDDDELTV